MKKIMLVCAMLTGTLLCNAQDMVVKLNPVGLIFGALTVGVEKVVTDEGSAQLNMSFISRTIGAFGLETKYSGLGISPEYRHHVGSHDNPKGPYLGGFVGINSFKSTFTDGLTGSNNNNTLETKYFGIGGGLILGYEWIISDAFALDLTVGGGYQSVSAKVVESSGDLIQNSDFGLASSGIFPRLSFAIGYAF